MITLRNVLLAANGCLLILSIRAIASDLALLRVLSAMVMIYDSLTREEQFPEMASCF